MRDSHDGKPRANKGKKGSTKPRNATKSPAKSSIKPKTAKKTLPQANKETKAILAEKRGKGRPPIFTPEIEALFLEGIARAISVRALCALHKVDQTTFFRHLEASEEFRQQYARAKERCADFMAEEILEIADDSSGDVKTVVRADGSEFETMDAEFVARSRLKVDARKWLAAKLRPKVYGEKIEHSGDKDNPITLASVVLMPPKA